MPCDIKADNHRRPVRPQSEGEVTQCLQKATCAYTRLEFCTEVVSKSATRFSLETAFKGSTGVDAIGLNREAVIVLVGDVATH
jgi:hypothetical protein